MSHWKVQLSRRANSELRELLTQNVITKSDVKVLLRWVDEMEEFGPNHIANSIEWHDHELTREWVGYRSSAFSKQGRVIYRILDKMVIVEVDRVTTNHNYRKEKL